MAFLLVERPTLTPARGNAERPYGRRRRASIAELATRNGPETAGAPVERAEYTTATFHGANLP